MTFAYFYSILVAFLRRVSHSKAALFAKKYFADVKIFAVPCEYFHIIFTMKRKKWRLAEKSAAFFKTIVPAIQVCLPKLYCFLALTIHQSFFRRRKSFCKHFLLFQLTRYEICVYVFCSVIQPFSESCLLRNPKRLDNS